MAKKPDLFNDNIEDSRKINSGTCNIFLSENQIESQNLLNVPESSLNPGAEEFIPNRQVFATTQCNFEHYATQTNTVFDTYTPNVLHNFTPQPLFSVQGVNDSINNPNYQFRNYGNTPLYKYLREQVIAYADTCTTISVTHHINNIETISNEDNINSQDNNNYVNDYNTFKEPPDWAIYSSDDDTPQHNYEGNDYNTFKEPDDSTNTLGDNFTFTPS